MQPITELPSFFVARFAQLCSSGINTVGSDFMRPTNLKDSARLLVEEILSGFPELVPTDNLEVLALCVLFVSSSWNAVSRACFAEANQRVRHSATCRIPLAGGSGFF